MLQTTYSEKAESLSQIEILKKEKAIDLQQTNR